MPTFEDATVDANEVREAARALAHATRSIKDPREIYSVLGDLTSATASLSQCLHQLGSVHDQAAGHASATSSWSVAESRAAHAAAAQVSWELHRAGDMVRQVSSTIGEAHNAEAKITYTRERPMPGTERLSEAERGLGL